ncbi:DNA-directed RNA polymerase, mitochondrial [Orussus abietinus]|uniref:DNA-directed RNA polymerase, mitochondrial n=1 Tax=Orussus abietinus TaxID=222816 RepID=UPI0006267CFC|nr:DNA-directed RNA polymerase, mitochondrial [Orussus abietinus]
MYRLLKVQRVVVQGACRTSICSNTREQARVCSFCKFYHNEIRRDRSYVHFRQYSTTLSTAMMELPLKKKSKRKLKKYTELLEVSDGATNNKKAAVQKLDAASLSMLVDDPGIALDQLNKIEKKLAVKKKRKKKSNKESVKIENTVVEPTTKSDVKRYSKTERQEIFQNSGALNSLDETDILSKANAMSNPTLLQTIEVEDDEIDDKPVEDGSKSTKSKRTENLKKSEDPLSSKVMKERMKLARERCLLQSLLAYVHVCIHCGLISQALEVVKHYRKFNAAVPDNLVIRNLNLYNILLKYYASTANFNKVNDIRYYIQEDGLKPNTQTYAALFECIGRMEKSDYFLNYLRDIQEEMTENNISLNDVVIKAKFVQDQQKHVLAAIRLLKPEFQPQHVFYNIPYNCSLVNKLSQNKAFTKSPAKGLQSNINIYDKIEQQLKWEKNGIVHIKSIAPQKLTPTVMRYREEVEKLEKMWEKTATEAFDRDLNILKNRKIIMSSQMVMLYPYMCVLDKQEYIKVIVHEAKIRAQGSMSYSPTLQMLCKWLGNRIFSKYEILYKQNNGVLTKTEEVYTRYFHWYMNKFDTLNTRTKWQKLSHEASKCGSSLNVNCIQWPVSVLVNVGRFLYDIILKDLKFNVNGCKTNNDKETYLPAFYSVFKTSSSSMREEVNPHPVLARLYELSQPEILSFDTTEVPMVCPPRPWDSVNNGGFLVTKTNLVRVSQTSVTQWDKLSSCRPSQVYPVLDSLNQLSSIPWRINPAILKVVLEVFRHGGSVKLNVPQPPSVLPPLPVIQSNAPEAEIKEAMRLRLRLKRQGNEMYSLWCDMLYRLSIAEHLKNDIFWLPHNMDFRGRVYPLPPHLNHLGSDLPRSLLTFALGKPLGKNGLDWLKIHVINLTGRMKKEPVKNRLECANRIMDDILDSAENPLTGKMWWAEAEEPWQTLAACMEISAALGSPDPEKYVSKFPVHQDGSCNGLQHYAALGRDQPGAVSVNLFPSEKPQDVYSAVVDLVEKVRQQDAENGVEIARALNGFISRKVIKQTVMTTVYGVTKFGARIQIAKQLTDIENFPRELVWTSSAYLVIKTFECLRSMFNSAREIQDWLTECARVITMTCKQNVEWVTPLGFPVVQPYCKLNRTVDSRRVHQLLSMDSFELPNTMKQRNAFAPNFIHSLDSTHMMLTSLYCENADVTFASVHDCFWTHACTVDLLNKICREQFVALHSQPILEDLSSFFIDRYNVKHLESICLSVDDKRSLFRIFQRQPKKGSFDLKQVLDSIYFFS